MKVLLAYDGFEHSRHALEEVAMLAAGGKAEVTVMSVVPPDRCGSEAGGHVGLRPHAHEDIANAHEFLLSVGSKPASRPATANRQRRSSPRPGRAATT
jgi:nucleotide-binding universal stress UspA family protein